MIYNDTLPLKGNNNRPGSGDHYGYKGGGMDGTIIHLYVECACKLVQDTGLKKYF